MPDPLVVVVGAGPVGLTCAALLGRAGVPVRVLEAEPVRPRELRASTWHPPTLDLLDGLGFAAPLVAAGLVTPTWQVRLHPSGERAVFDLGVLAGDTAHPYRLQCEQQVYCELVEAALPPGVVVRDATVTGLTQDERGVTVAVRCTGEAPAPLRAAWVIGADGARSAVRAAVGLGLDGSTYPETTILATTDFPFEQHLAGLSNVNYCWTDAGTFSLLRLPRCWRVSLYPDDGESVEAALAPAAIAAKLDRIVPGAAAAGALEVRPYRIHRRLVADYRRGRVLLAGDAAHLNSPSGGMGMNGGLHDAFSLCAELVAVLGGADPALLDRYTRRRRPVAAEEILAQADQNRARMQERDPARRRQALADLQAIAADPARAREYLLRSSMLTGLRRAATIA